jgi:hypothetical protein
MSDEPESDYIRSNGHSVFGGDDHSCWGKAREVQKRLGIMLGLDSHNVISEMCRMWGVQNADEFYARMNNMSDDELRATVEAAWDKVKKRKRLMQTVTQEMITPYA